MESFIILDREKIFSYKNNLVEDDKYNSTSKLLLDIKKKLLDKYSSQKKNIPYNRKRKEDYGWRFISKNSNVLKATDDTDRTNKKIIGILNKLTPSNLSVLSESLKEHLTKELFVKFLIDGIFSNAIIQPNNCKTYVELCIILSKYILENYDINIQNLILEKANSYLSEFKEIKSSDDKNYDEYCLQIKKKLCNIGNIQLLAELYKSEIIKENTIDEILTLLLENTSPEKLKTESPEYIINNIDSLFKLITIIYKKNNKFITKNLEFFQERSKNKIYPPKSRFIFMDILDIHKKLKL